MAPKVSLLDLIPGVRYFEWVVVYYPRDAYFFWANWLQQGFRHCELWRPYKFGPSENDQIWLRVTPTFEILEADLEFDPRPPWIRFPGATCQRVQVLSTARKMRQWFHVGPVSCTEIVKNALGINSFWMRTPYQLYRHLLKHGGVVKA